MDAAIRRHIHLKGQCRRWRPECTLLRMYYVIGSESAGVGLVSPSMVWAANFHGVNSFVVTGELVLYMYLSCTVQHSLVVDLAMLLATFSFPIFKISIVCRLNTYTGQSKWVSER